MIKTMSNMHLVTGYAGKTHVTAADHGAFWAAVVGNGEYVLDAGQKFAATKISDNQIRIADGEMLIQGRHARIPTGEPVDLTIENGTAETLRRDLIVARYTKSEETGVEDVNLIVLLGTAAETAPTDPEYITGDILNGASQRDFPLYRVNLNGVTIESIEKLFTEIPGTLFDRIAETEEKINAVENTANTANNNASNAQTAANSATKIKTGSYTGTGRAGSSGKNILTLGFKPKYLCVYTRNPSGYDAAKKLSVVTDPFFFEFYCAQSSSNITQYVRETYSWSSPPVLNDSGNRLDFIINFTDTGVEWYLSGSYVYDGFSRMQLNMSGVVYDYFAIG